ncbi:MAG TPA: helix-turn-helix domain-containing protein [bacterium]|nr:helix-turn-helix domain-containing protein [bacterium]
MPTLGERIRAARLERTLTQEQLAGSDLTKSYISQLERDRRTPHLITLKALARRLDKPLSYFLDGIPEDREAEVFLGLGQARLQAQAAMDVYGPLERALELAADQGDERLQARIELALATADQQLGHLLRAQRRLDRCLRVIGRVGDVTSLVAAHDCLGRTKMGIGDAASALWAFQTALQLAGKLPYDPIWRARLCLALGIAYKTLGNIPAAREAFVQGLNAASVHRDPAQVAAWHLRLADTAVEEGRLEQAVQQAGRATAVYEILAHHRRHAEIHERLGEIARDEGDYAEAERHYWRSIELHGGSGNGRGAAQSLGSFAAVLLEHASPDTALAMCEAALGLLTGVSDRGPRARALMMLGAIRHKQGRRDEAKIAFREALALFAALNQDDDVRLARQQLALLALEAEDLAEARQHLEGLCERPVRR